MKKIVLFIFVIFFSKGFTQTVDFKREKYSDAEIKELFRTYEKKALWFQDMPQYNNDSSAFYFEKSIKVLQPNLKFFELEMAQIYYHRSNLSSFNNSYEVLDSLAHLGWFYFNKSLKRRENSQFEYDFLVNWSLIKLETGNTNEALNLFSKAILLANDFKTEEQKAKVLADKGYYYQRNGIASEQKLALSYLLRSCDYYEKIGIEKKPLVLSNIYIDLIAYYSYGDFEKRFYYLGKLHSLLNYLKKPQKHAWYYVTYGRDLITYPLKGAKKIPKEQYKQGKYFIVKALNILEKYKISKNSIKPFAYGLLADIYMNEKKYDFAINNYKKSKQGYALLKNKKAASDMNFYIAKAYETKENYATALSYFKQYYTEFNNIEKEVNERSLRENELKVDLLQQEKEIDKKRKQQYLYLILLLIALVLFALLFWNFKLKQKSNKLLAFLNNDLESKNNLLDKKNAENELLLREIHHRVKNNLEIVSSLLALQSDQIDDLKTKDAMSESQNRVNSIGIVHQKLYQGTHLGVVEMKDYFLNLSESILDSFGAEQRVDLELAMENLDLDIDTAVPLGLIVNELLTNCIKYAFPKGKKGTITIKLHKQDNNILRLIVADNGVGKCGMVHGTGFGSQLISLLTQQLNGTITEENQNGTKLIFDFKMKAA